MLFQQGKPQFNWWKGEIPSADLRAYRRDNWSNLWLGTREKRWQYVGLYSDEFIVGLAVVHAGYVGNIFAYVYNRTNYALWEVHKVLPLAKGIRFDREIHNAVVDYSSSTERIRFESNLPLHKRSVDVRLHHEGQDLDIRVEIVENLQKTEPLQVLMPTMDDDCTFTHKHAGLSVLGSIRLGNQRWKLDKTPTFAAIDLTTGYPARKTFWNWASMAGTVPSSNSTKRRSIGLNVVSPIIDPINQENAFWVDGKLHKLGAVGFNYNPDDIVAPWSISSQDMESTPRIDLQFTPEGLRKQDIDLQIISSAFQQPFGRYNGTVTCSDGEVIKIEDISGVAEEHYAKW